MEKWGHLQGRQGSSLVSRVKSRRRQKRQPEKFAVNNQQQQMSKKVGQYLLTKDKLGEGAFSQVFRGELNGDESKQFAIKVIVKKSIVHDEYMVGSLLNEVSIMKKMSNQHIVKLEDVLETANNYYIVQELCQGGSLRDLLNGKALTQAEALDLFRQVLKGCLTLLKAGIIHRDLKPENMMMSKNGTLKIGDFGLARNLKNFKHQQLKTIVGTPFYMAPQLLNSECYTSKCDIWSLGIIFFQMLERRHPFKAHTEVQLYRKCVQNKIVFSEIKDPLVIEFIRKCLRPEEDERFSWEQLFRHPLHRACFESFISSSERLENKLAFVVVRLRCKVLEYNINIQKLFADSDLTMDCYIDKVELYKLLLSIDPSITKEEAVFIFNVLDKDCNGRIDMDEFEQWCRENKISNQQSAVQGVGKEYRRVCALIRRKTEALQQNTRQFFQERIRRREEDMGLAEFVGLLMEIDEGLTPFEHKLIFDKFDLNHDGLVSCAEFMAFMAKMAEEAPGLSEADKARVEDFRREVEQSDRLGRLDSAV